jgi:inosose dehydratase
VLTEMRDIGLAATEFGPDGFLPDTPEGKARTLTEYGLHGVGGFTPVVLYRPDHDPAPEIDRVLDGFEAVGARVLVLSADSGMVGYDARPDLDSVGWDTLLRNLDRLAGQAAARGVTAVLHPHVGTMIEKGDEVQRVLENSSISLCLDTGHLLIGGTDPLELTQQVPDRIEHAHLKDVNAELAARVQSGELTYTQAVAAGMYVPLGAGDVDIAGIVKTLEDNGYDGWYVMEQDNILDGEPEGEGPLADVRASVAFLHGVYA